MDHRWVAEPDVEHGERGWHFNSGRLQITLGICGDAQESSFMNATLQGAGKDDLEFSIAVHVEVPDGMDTEEKLADYLGGLFSQIVHDYPALHVEMQIGPFGRGEED